MLWAECGHGLVARPTAELSGRTELSGWSRARGRTVGHGLGQEALSLLKRLFRSWLIAPWPGGMTPSRRRTCTFWRHFSAA